MAESAAALAHVTASLFGMRGRRHRRSLQQWARGGPGCHCQGSESATFRQMWEQCKEHGEERSARTIAAYQQVLDQYVMDEIGDMPR